MEASRSSARLDASTQEQHRRRPTKAASIGRRRRRASNDRERMPDGTDGHKSGDGMDASKASSSRRMDNSSSAYSNQSGGGSSRRQLQLQQAMNNSGLNSSKNGLQAPTSSRTSTSSSTMDASTGYTQKYKAAQELLERHQLRQKQSSPPNPQQRTTRRRASAIGSTSAPVESELEHEGHHHNHHHHHVERTITPPNTKVTQPPPQRTAERYKGISRGVGGSSKSTNSRRQSMDSSATGDSSSRNHRKSTAIPPRTTSNSLTATRLKKVFSGSGDLSGGVTKSRSKSPSRGVSRQASLPTHHKTTRRVERKPSGTEQSISANNGHGEEKSSRRSSMPSGAAATDDGNNRLRRHTTTKHPQDMAARTTLSKTPNKTKSKSNMDMFAILDTSMPSLAALDLSVHTNGTFKSFLTTTTGTSDHNGRQLGRGRKSPPVGLLHQQGQSISLLFDNAQSHATTNAMTATKEDAETVEEASTICNSVGDVYSGAASVDTTDPTANKGMDISRSDNTNSSQGSGAKSTSRRRADDGNPLPRRVRSPKAAARSRSQSTKRETNRRNASSRSLSRNPTRSTSSERKRQQRRASIATTRMSRNNSVSSLPKEDSKRALQRSNTTSAVATKRAKGAPGLQRSNTGEPRRQKSVSSLKCAGHASTKSVTSTMRKSKKDRSQSMLSESLSAIDTMWVRGSVVRGDTAAKSKFQEAVNAVMATLEKEHKAARYSSATSVLSTNSSQGNSSRRSAASSGGSRKHRRESRRRSVDNSKHLSEPRSSDATWSLADIDLGSNDGGKKDASVVTPVTESSSSGEVLDTEARRTKKGISRSKSMDGKRVDKSSRQASQKSFSSAASRKEQKRQETRKSQSSKGGLVEETELVTTAALQGSKTFEVDADDLDPFDSQHSLPFGGSAADPFAASGMIDPFGLAVRTSVEATKKKKVEDDLGPSFHMTNDFGDFGHQSFGSINFDDSQHGFMAIQGKETPKSLLG